MLFIIILFLGIFIFSMAFISGKYEKDYCEKCSLRYNCEAYQTSNPKICQYFEPEN